LTVTSINDNDDDMIEITASNNMMPESSPFSSKIDLQSDHNNINNINNLNNNIHHNTDDIHDISSNKKDNINDEEISKSTGAANLENSLQTF